MSEIQEDNVIDNKKIVLKDELFKILKQISKDTVPLYPDLCNVVTRGIEIGQKSNIGRCKSCGNYQEADKKYYSPDIKNCSNCNEQPLKLMDIQCISSQTKTKQYIKKCIAGKHIQAYEILNDSYFIPQSLDGIDYKERHFSGNKILVKRISPQLVGAFSSETLYAFNTVYTIRNNSLNKFDFMIILAIINSSLMHFYHELYYNLGMKLTTLITIDWIKKLPIRLPKNEKMKNDIITCVESMISLNELHMKDNTKEIALLKEIDDLVYELYEINNDDRIIIKEYLHQ